MRKRRPFRSRISKQFNKEMAPSAVDHEEPLVVRPKRARRILGDPSESTFWNWVRQGEFEIVRVGPNLTWVTVASLRAFIARHTVDTAD